MRTSMGSNLTSVEGCRCRAKFTRQVLIGAAGCWILIVVLAPVAVAQCIQFKPGQSLKSGAGPLAPGSYAIPCVADWNGDGRKDLLAGYQSAGKIAVYLNVGTDASPVFTNYINLQAGGADIHHPAGSCGAPAPFVCDYDGDGRRDLLVGEGNSGFVYFYRNTNTDAAPILAPGVQLAVGASPLGVVWRAAPFVYDWDGDGLKDLLSGNGDGFVYFFKNTGTAQSPAYAPGAPLQVGGTPLNLGPRSVVRMFDWDGDGKPDLVGSSGTGVYWCRNTGSGGAPQLQTAVALCAPVSGSGLVAINTGYRMRMDLVDWNNDGTIDLLVGNYNGTVSFYEGYQFACTALVPAPVGRQAIAWRSAPYLSYSVWAGSSPGALTNRVAANVPSGGDSTAWTNNAAGAQQFYRLQIAP